MAEIGKDILKAAAILKEGGLVAIPTETVYGLAGNALSPDAVARIFAAKNRPFFDPLIVHVGTTQPLTAYAERIPEKARALMKRFWPGPLTILLPRQQSIPDLVTSGLERVGLRCPDHPMTLELLAALPFPLAAPSANPFGYVSPTSPQHVNDQLGSELQYILDGGICKVGIESTVVGFENDKPVVYRLGGLQLEDIETLIGQTALAASSLSNPLAPGQLQSHYAPRKPLLIGDIRHLVEEHKAKSLGVLSLTRLKLPTVVTKEIVLSDTGDLSEAAQRLFAALRELDESDVDVILSALVPDKGLGRAINDRLKRASVKR